MSAIVKCFWVVRRVARAVRPRPAVEAVRPRTVATAAAARPRPAAGVLMARPRVAAAAVLVCVSGAGLAGYKAIEQLPPLHPVEVPRGERPAWVSDRIAMAEAGGHAVAEPPVNVPLPSGLAVFAVAVAGLVLLRISPRGG